MKEASIDKNSGISIENSKPDLNNLLKILGGTKGMSEMMEESLNSILNSDVPELNAKITRKTYDALRNQGFTRTSAVELTKVLISNK